MCLLFGKNAGPCLFHMTASCGRSIIEPGFGFQALKGWWRPREMGLHEREKECEYGTWPLSESGVIREDALGFVGLLCLMNT